MLIKKKVLVSTVIVLVIMMVGITCGWSADQYGKNIDPKWMTENRWDKWGRDDQMGALNEVTPQMILDAIKLIKEGKVYDLETVRFKGMPVWPGHSGWELLPYASPVGRQNMTKDGFYESKYTFYGKGGWLDYDINKYNAGLNSEIIIGPLHVGTHIDTLCHLTIGEDNHWWNGFNFEENWSDYGPLKADASNIPPIILRGVLLDIAGYKGVDYLENSYGISVEDIKGCAKWEGISIKRGDCVLLRTGIDWPGMKQAANAGPTLEACMYLVGEKDIFLIGDDQSAFENFPLDAAASFPGHPHPCHQYLLIQNGVHLMEMVQMDELARDKVYEFCFIVLSCKVKGATGMMIRPIAVK